MFQYMVKNSSGSTMIMDEKVEARDAQVFQEHYDRCLEKLVEEVEKGLTTEAESTGKPRVCAAGRALKCSFCRGRIRNGRRWQDDITNSRNQSDL